MISFKALAILGCCLNGFLLLFGALALFMSGYKQTKVVEDLKRYFRSSDYSGSLEYLKGKVRTAALHKLVEPMISATDTPHRIPLLHEEAHVVARKMVYRRWWMNTTARVLSVGWIVGLAVLYWITEPAAHGWAVAYVILSFVTFTYTHLFYERAKKDIQTLVMVRNALLFSLDYIPAEYRGHVPRTDAEREAWREAVGRVERRVLAGKDAEKATSDELERIATTLEQVARDPEGGVPPANRLGMLMGEVRDQEAI